MVMMVVVRLRGRGRSQVGEIYCLGESSGEENQKKVRTSGEKRKESPDEQMGSWEEIDEGPRKTAGNCL